MTNEELKAEIDLLRRDFQALAAIVSHQAAGHDAVGAALLGLLTVVGASEDVRTAVDQQLERRHAIDLGQSVNQPAVDGFQETADLIRLAMKHRA